MKSVLLDTNGYSRFMEEGGKVQELLENSDTVYISSIVLGELLSGFKKGVKYKNNLKNLEIFLSKSNVKTISVSSSTSEIYANIKHKLQKKGTPVPTNDIWIAANAIETGSKIITFDKHFLKIPGVRL